MMRRIPFLIPFLMLGAAHAAEIQDAPITEPNYLGIAVFLLLFVGGSIWFMWRLMRKDGKDKQNKGGNPRP